MVSNENAWNIEKITITDIHLGSGAAICETLVNFRLCAMDKVLAVSN